MVKGPGSDATTRPKLHLIAHHHHFHQTAQALVIQFSNKASPNRQPGNVHSNSAPPDKRSRKMINVDLKKMVHWEKLSVTSTNMVSVKLRMMIVGYGDSLGR